jgi:cytochrome b pre-mRNA-processing protein 3
MILFSRARRRDREAAQRIYASAVASARRPAFYLRCGVPDTLQGRFEMIALNLFPVLHRLMHDPGDDPALARLVAESFVEDMDGALRDIGVSDTRMPKRMKVLYGSFAGRISAYKRALGEGDASLANAVSRNVYPDGVDDTQVNVLVAYLKATLDVARAVDLAALRRGEMPFPEPLPERSPR